MDEVIRWVLGLFLAFMGWCWLPTTEEEGKTYAGMNWVFFNRTVLGFISLALAFAVAMRWFPR